MSNESPRPVVVCDSDFGPYLEIAGFNYTIHKEITEDMVVALSLNAGKVVASRVERALREHLEMIAGGYK